MDLRRKNEKSHRGAAVLKKGAALGAAILVLVLLFLFGFQFAAYFSVRGEIKSIDGLGPEDSGSVIVVFGAGVWDNREPSPILRNRLQKAIELYEKGYGEAVYVTGDHREGEYDEVDVMKEYLITHHVPENCIFTDYRGFSTYESMKNLRACVSGEKLLLVTQQYHLYRAAYIGKKKGMNITGVIAENAGGYSGRIMRTVREMFATVKDIIYCAVD